MRVDELVRRMGGVADARLLVARTSRRKVRTALHRGEVVRLAKGRYALPTAKTALREANRLNGVVSGKSAALYYGWAMKALPELPTVTVPRNRKVDPNRREGVDLKWRNVPKEHLLHGVTSKAWTVIDCARTLPFDEALAIADSAMRCGHVTKWQLLMAAEAMPDRYRSRCLRVAWHADRRAANPFESVLRAIALDVPGLYVVPQEWTDDVGHPDLVDKRLRLVIEAESFEFHGKRRALYQDCERYNAFAMKGWWVIRFAWEHVMFEPEYVREVLTRMVALLSGQPPLVPPAQRRSASAAPAAGRSA